MGKMRAISQARIVDVTEGGEYENYLYKCLAPMPFRRYSNRKEYLKRAVPKGFHKRVLIINGEVVGTIEYAPAEVSGYPIIGEGMIVMNCAWILRKAKGHDFEKLLEKDIVNSEKDAGGFAPIALENIGVHGSRKV